MGKDEDIEALADRVYKEREAERQRNYQREYYRTHREQVLAYNREYKRTHKEQIQKQIERRKEHPDQVRRYMRRKDERIESNGNNGSGPSDSGGSVSGV